VKSDPPPRPTVKLIAAKAGLSGAAVSLALRDHPSIPPRTRARVRRLADQLGYRVDPNVSRLMSYLRQRPQTRKVGVIGVLHQFPTAKPWRENPSLRRIHAAATERAIQFGYELEECWLAEPGMTAARKREILLARGIEGLLVLGTPQWVEKIDFDFSPFACAATGYSLRTPLHRACQHQYQEMFTALRHLEALGYRRPGLVLTEDSDHRTMQHWSAAFFAAQRHWDESRRVPPLFTPDLNEQAFRAWFKAEGPDVVIAHKGAKTIARDWLSAAGARVPATCGFADLDVDAETETPYSGIRQNNEQVSAAAIDLVIGQLQRHERGLPKCPKIVLVEGGWVNGATTRPPP
jgi:LacI family transcriptional regulator